MSHSAQWLVPSVIALVALTGLILSVTKLMSLLQMQNQLIRSLTNLAASKDLAAFTTLETIQPTSEPTEYAPLDDTSMAERMAEYYQANGMDPMHAYADDDPLADFGGTEAFR